MPTFAIVRQDGEVDTAEGQSVDDIAARFGWPGNGTIEPFDSAKHEGARRHSLTSPEHQRELFVDAPVEAAPSIDELVTAEVKRQLKAAAKATDNTPTVKTTTSFKDAAANQGEGPAGDETTVTEVK